MSDPFRTPEDYELFLYSLVERFPSISRSTLVFVRVGATMARIAGELFLKNGIRLMIRERAVFDRLPLVIDGYGYEAWRGEKKLYWYDSQPHPNEPACKARIHIINISRLTSNATVSLRQRYISTSRIFPGWWKKQEDCRVDFPSKLSRFCG